MTLKKMGRVYDSLLEETFHIANPHLKYHPTSPFRWTEPSKYPALIELINTLPIPEGVALWESLTNEYRPDFYDEATGIYIETKGYPLSAKDRTKYRAIVKQNPYQLLKFVVQVRINQTTEELVALLTKRNELLLLGKTQEIGVKKVSKQITSYLSEYTKPHIKGNIAGLLLVRWLVDLPALVEIFPVKTHKKGGL